MALGKSSDIPKDAIAFADENEAAQYIWDIVYEWESPSQTWALRYGPMILGAVNSMCGLIVNKHFRTRFKLASLGYLSTTIPISLMPGVLTTLFHNYLVPTDMLLMKTKSCPICYELRSAVIQSGFGTAYPMILGPTSALMLANRYATIRVPDLTDGAKVMFSFLRKHTKPFTGTLVYMVAIQVAASSIITYFEMKNYHTVKQELMEIERKVLAEHGDSGS